MSLKRKLKNKWFIAIAFGAVIIFLVIWEIKSFTEKSLPEEENYKRAIEFFRKDKEEEIKAILGKINQNAENGFPISGEVKEFRESYYFPISKKFVFKSKLYLYEEKQNKTFRLTNGKLSNSVCIGYFKIIFNNKEYNLSCLLSRGKDSFIAFRDLTNGKTTPKSGRYIKINITDDPDLIYNIDFNLAFFFDKLNFGNESIEIVNDNILDFAVNAGERLKIQE